MTRPRLALFDLDHTLLLGDSDVLWCEFLMRRGVIARAEFGAAQPGYRGALPRRLATGGVHAFLRRHAGRAFAGPGSAARDAFMTREITPRIPAAPTNWWTSHRRWRPRGADQRHQPLPDRAHGRWLGIEHLLGSEPGDP